jgi:hypothetical protein
MMDVAEAVTDHRKLGEGIMEYREGFGYFG